MLNESVELLRSLIVESKWISSLLKDLDENPDKDRHEFLVRNLTDFNESQKKNIASCEALHKEYLKLKANNDELWVQTRTLTEKLKGARK